MNTYVQMSVHLAMLRAKARPAMLQTLRFLCVSMRYTIPSWAPSTSSARSPPISTYFHTSDFFSESSSVGLCFACPCSLPCGRAAGSLWAQPWVLELRGKNGAVFAPLQQGRVTAEPLAFWMREREPEPLESQRSRGAAGSAAGPLETACFGG